MPLNTNARTDGPLFLTAGPGTGKTRVLLWRTLNLIVLHEVPPDEIFLGTFTEKAALQLKQGLTAYLSLASNISGRPYDISRMLVGTVHSICRRVLSDRRFSRGRMRPGGVALADELDQFFFLLKQWDELLEAAGFERNANLTINQYLSGRSSHSRHGAVAAAISLFNRLSEECIVPEQAIRRTRDPVLKQLLRMYGAYKQTELTDLSLLQQAALDHLRASDQTQHVLRHVIVDEYQDTNHVQEALFFHLAGGHRNLCVVGDDDQALYRFRGSTVENLVEFEDRCNSQLGIPPERIDLGRNYRSRRAIVEFYRQFIEQIDWKKGPGKKGAYRVEGKRIEPDSSDAGPAVVASTPATPEAVCAEVAALVQRLIKEGKVEDANQVAFLYPSLKSEQVHRMIGALENKGLKVYAPRAGQFLEVPEALDIFGLLLVLFGCPASTSPGMAAFFEWVYAAHKRGKQLARADRSLATFLKSRQDQMQRAIRDRNILLGVVGNEPLDENISDAVIARLRSARGLSTRAIRYLRGGGLTRLVQARRRQGRRLSVAYVINRVTTLDWGILDLFYELTAFTHFRHMFDLAERGHDEGPICNLALITQYLGRFQAQNSAVLSASFLDEGKFVRTFFNSFLYALWRRGESEYEDAEDPFPKGRIPFLTVHQAKGLEFPVIVLGNPRKQESVQKVEEIVRPFLNRSQGEPLHRIATFDVARMFYVALSRPQNLLVLCHYAGRGQHINEVKLSLPGQVTPKGRRFVIEGVVDIVREGELVRMYDLKTHEEQDVRAERDLYEAQLNVYAHIWKGIRGQPLNETAVIATRLPLEVRDAIRSGDPAAIAAALAAWEPVVDLPFDEDKVQQTIEDFGCCVDAIEDGEFSPPPPEKLREVRGTRKRKGHGAGGGKESEMTFAQAHCQSCDARFSCSSYRAYQKEEAGRQRRRSLSVVQDEAAERELDAWIEENLAES